MLLLLLLIRILCIDLAGLADADAFTLPGDLDIWIVLASDDDVLLDQLDSVVLAVRDLLRRVAAELLGIQDLAHTLSSLDNLITILRVFVQMEL